MRVSTLSSARATFWSFRSLCLPIFMYTVHNGGLCALYNMISLKTVDICVSIWFRTRRFLSFLWKEENYVQNNPAGGIANQSSASDKSSVPHHRDINDHTHVGTPVAVKWGRESKAGKTEAQKERRERKTSYPSLHCCPLFSFHRGM